MNEAYIQAINGDSFSGNMSCYLSSGSQIQLDTPYDVLTDFHNCSTISGGFSISALSATVGRSVLYFYFGYNGPCSTLYGPLAAPAPAGSSLARDASVGGAVYGRVGGPGCELGTECQAIALTAGVCDSQIGENAEVSVALYSILVTDRDGLGNTELTYSLINSALSDSFSLNMMSGTLTLARSLDRENTEIINLRGLASDGMFSGNFSIRVEVLDENDNDPIPVETIFRASLAEGLPSNTFVTVTRFTDADDGGNARLMYDIASSDFAYLDSSIADIYTTREFDYENGDRLFIFEVSARDGGSTPRVGQANVSVTILDVNDNRPTIQLTAGDPYVEDATPVAPASAIVSDTDSNTYPILFAVVSIVYPLNMAFESLSLPSLPSGYKLGYFDSTLYVVGAGTPSQYSSLLSNILYENVAPTFELPLMRSISYGVCDMLANSLNISMLSEDTQQALTAMAVTSDLPAQDASILGNACFELISSSVNVSLVETNDRPVVLADVAFPDQPEDLPSMENRGTFVSSLFELAISDSDRNSVTGIAVTEYDSDGAATPELGIVGSNPECLSIYEQISLMQNGCNGRQLNASNFCECSSPKAITCITSPSTVIFTCLDSRNARACTCPLPSQSLSQPSLPPFSEISSVYLDLGTGEFELSLALGNSVSFRIDVLEELFNFTVSSSAINVTLRNGSSYLTRMAPFNVVYEPFGAVEQQAALLLGPLSIIRWVSLPNRYGNGSFSFKGWDTTNNIEAGTRGANASISDDTSYSLTKGLATVTITPVNDRPVLLLQGSDANYSTEYTEGTAVHVAGNVSLLDIDSLVLSDLTVRIYPMGGSCEVPGYSEPSGDVLIHTATSSLTLSVSIDRIGQACVNYLFLGSMSVSNWQSLLMSLRFNITDNEPSDHTRMLEFVINDEASSSIPVFTTISVALVSDTCPVVSIDSSSPITYTENGPPVVVGPSINVTDGDRNAIIQSASVQILDTPNVRCSGCVLNISSSSISSQIHVSFDQTSRILMMQGSATPEEYQRLLRSVVFADEGEEPTFSLVTVRFMVQDPVVTTCDDIIADQGVMVEHINDISPELYLDYPISQDFNQTFIEGSGSVSVSSSVFIQDRDGLDSPAYRVVVTISSECYPSEDRLEFSSTIVSTLLSGYNTSTCSLELEGNLTNLVGDIANLQYINLNADNPISSTRSIEFVISDEALPSTTSTALLRVIGVNDAPIIDLNATNSFSPNVTRRFEGSPISIASNGLVSDPEGDLVELLTFTLTEVDSMGNTVARSDLLYEDLEVSADVLARYNLSGSFFAQTNQLVVTGLATGEAYSEVLNNCFYSNRRFPVTDDNIRQVTVTARDNLLTGAPVASTIIFRVSRNAPMLDLDSESVGINVEAEYRSTNSPLSLFPNAVLMDMDRDNICRLDLLLTGCLSSQIGFSNAYPDISLNTTSTSEASRYVLTTRFSDCREAIIFQDVVRGVTISNMNPETSDTCSLSVVATDDQEFQSVAAMATITIRAFNLAPFIDLDLGLGGRDYSTVYFQGGNLQRIVSFYNASSARNITDVTVVGEAMAAGEAPSLGATEIGSYDDGTIYHGVVINEQSNAGFVVMDTDSPTLSYLQVEFFSSSHLEQDAIAYPCVTTAPLPPYGCDSSDSSPTTFMTPTCNSSVFDSCHIQDLCTDLRVTIFCPSPGRKAYRFEYLQNALVRRYETLLGLLGYDFLPRTGGQISQMRLLNITVLDPLSNSVNPIAITRIRIRSQENLIIVTEPSSFVVYEDERPRRTCNLYQITLRRLDGTTPSPSEVIYNISQGNTGDAFGVTEDGIIFLNNAVDREAIDMYNLTISVRLRIANPDTTSSAFIIANVIDVNDNPPVTRDVYNVNVTEMLVNETVVQLVVTDRDEGLNAEFNYFVLGIGESNFAVDENGRIYTTVPLNRSAEDYYLLVVVIYDRGMIPLATHTVVNVMVVTPLPTEIEFRSPLPPLYLVIENTPIGTALAPSLQAFEVGGSDEFIRYRINNIMSDSPNMNASFEVNAITGVVTVVGNLNSELVRSYIIYAEAFSIRSLFPPRSGFLNITVNITDENEGPPVFDSPPYALDVVENVPISSTLLTFTASDSDIDNQGFVFSLLQTNVSSSFPFRVDPNGDLVVSGIVDYESSPFYVFEVLVTDIPLPGMVPLQGRAVVTITVLDLNDNPPEFIGTPYVASVNETAPNGSVVLNIASRDIDSFNNNAVFYSAMGLEETPFCLYENHTFIEVCNPQLLTSIEQENVVFVVTILATNPSPSGTLTTTTQANISVILVNEDSPAVAVPEVSLNITEEHCGRGRGSDCIGVVVFNVSTIATDLDGGRGGELSYRLVTTSVPFVVDMESGIVTVSGRIDREQRAMYSLDIEITDGGDSFNIVRSATTTINILVEDIEDNPPVIIAPFVFFVTESFTSSMAVFGQVQITDPDIVGSHFFMIRTNDDPPLHQGCRNSLPVQLNLVTGSFSFCRPVDFEEGPNEYTFEVLVINSGPYAPNDLNEFRVDHSFTVNILDSNDNPPSFSQMNYIFSVSENQPSGTVIGPVTATDLDSGDNALLQFVVIGGSNSSSCNPTLPFYFVKVNATTANMVQCEGLDYENQQQFSFQIQVEDSGFIPLSDISNVSITVIDRNDNPPVFSEEVYYMTITETDFLRTMDPVLRVSITDFDSPPNSVAVFSITSPANSPFGLRNATTDSVEVFVANPGEIDFESGITGYEIIVEARNEVPGDETQVDAALVNVTIMDINDNRPMILPPNSFMVRENQQPLGTSVGSVNAIDPDTGVGATLAFFIGSISEDRNCSSTSNFIIDRSTGEITTCQSFDYETQTTYSIVVIVCDSTIPPMCSNRSMVINIVDLNDNSPIFSEDPYIVNINELSPTGTMIGMVSSTDADTSPNSNVSYSLPNPDVPFSVSDGGVYFTGASSELDYELGNRSYILNIQALNPPQFQDDASQISNVAFVVNVIDRNDNPPVFPRTSDSVSIEEHASNMQVVYSLNTTDDDSLANSAVTYRILDEGLPFSIVGSDIVVQNSAAIDFDPPFNVRRYEITVGANNPPAAADDQTQTANFTLEISIEDVNDNIPICTGVTSFRQPEDALINVDLFEITAQDIDSGANGDILFLPFDTGMGDPLCSDDNIFSIDPDSGAISICQEFDYEIRMSYEVNFTICDLGTPRLCSTCPVNVAVTDVNDNSPVIHAPTVFTVSETEPVNYNIGCANATDADSLQNAELEYNFGNGVDDCSFNAPFNINDTSGCVFICLALDYETRQNYTLQVNVSDKGSPQLFTVASFIIHVENANDHRPTITSSNMASILEEEADRNVIRVISQDVDLPPFNVPTYSLIEDDGGRFAIDSVTGLITNVVPLDREEQAQRTIVVQVSDGLNTNNQTITVSLIDINDNPPEYLGSLNFTFMEMFNFSTVLLFRDNDTGDNARLLYSVDDSRFEIDSNGVLRNIMELDRDPDTGGNPQVDIAVTARDNTSDPLSLTVFLNITLLDINDNSPVLTTPIMDDIIDGTLAGTVVFTAEATDADDGMNAELRYFLGFPSDNFEVDENTGEIRLTQNIFISSDSPEVLEVTINVSDLGQPARFNSAVGIFVIVSSIPMLMPDVYEFSIVENSFGVVIGNVNASDRDINPFNDDFLFTIISVSPYDPGFTMQSSGTIGSLVSPLNYLDYEDARIFNIVIGVGRFNTSGIVDDMGNITVTIREQNDNIPRLSPVNISAEVTENSDRGTVVATLVAIDFDAGSGSGMINYNTSGFGADIFSINGNGDLVIDRPVLNFEESSSYTLTYQACDSGDIIRCSEVGYILINIVDVDDLPPVFSSATYSADIPEDFAPMQPVLNVSLTDRDTTLQDLDITLMPPQSQFQITIEANNGVAISTASPLDRETQSLYMFDVIARDPSGSSATASVTIRVTDINDEQPSVVPSSSVVQFMEEGAAVYPTRELDIVDGDITSMFPLVRTSVALRPGPMVSTNYPNPGGICDHANYTFLYQDNVFNLCGRSSCLSTLQEESISRFGDASFSNGILSIPSATSFARNSALLFNGDRLQNFTITTWVRFLSGQKAGTIYEIQGVNANVFELDIDSDGSLSIVGINDVLLRSDSLPTQDGEWHYIAFVRNGSHLVLYFDGRMVASSQDDNSIASDFIDGSFFFGTDLDSFELSEFYFCSLVVLSESDLVCSLTCGEYIDLLEPTPGVSISVSLRTRSIELVYSGTDPSLSLRSLENALRNISYVNVLDEPHPLDRYLVVTANDSEGSGNPAVVTLRPTLLNDKMPGIDLNGTANPGLDFFTSSNESSPTTLVIGPDAFLYDTDSGWFALESVMLELEAPQRSHRLEVPSVLPPGLMATYSNDRRTLLLEAFNTSHPVYPDTFLDVIRQVQYVNLREEQSQFVVSVRFTVTDLASLKNSPLSRTFITVLPINDPPELFLAAGASNTSVSYDERDGSVNLVNDVRIIDSDSTMLREATVSFTFRPDGLQESLRLNLDLIDVNPDSVDFSETLGVLTISHVASFSFWTDILHNVQYLNSNQDPSLQSRRQVVFAVQDAGGAYSNSAFVDIGITLENDPPVLFPGGPNVETYTAPFLEDGPCVPLLAPNAVIVDPDSTIIQSVQISLSANSRSMEEIIMYNGSDPQVSLFTFGGGTGLIITTVQSQNASFFTEIIRDLVYCNTIEEPENGTRTVSYATTDNGLANGLLPIERSTATSTVLVSNRNDQPSVTFTQLDDVSIRDTPIAIINSSSIVVNDNDDSLFDTLNIFITNPQDGSDDELIQFAAQLPSSSISRGPFDLSDGQILYTVTFTGGADVNRVTETISQLRYNNRADVLTPEPPRVICVQLSDFKIFSELSCVNVTISPPNFHSPAFVNGDRSFSFSETNSFTSVGVFMAADNDTGREGTVEYRIDQVVSTGRDGSAITTDIFTVNPSTGELVASTGFNADQYTSHVINLEASDQGNPVRMDMIIIQISVSDINDESPVFEGAPYVAPDIREDLEPPNNVFQVVANDGDVDPINSGNIQFSLHNFQDRFSIDPITGVIQTTVALDAEEQQIYIINVSASDSGNPPLVTYTTVTLTLVDLNDNTVTVEQQAPAIYVTDRGSSSIGPAARVVDLDLSPSAITSVQVSFVPSAADSSRTYDQCLGRCQDVRLTEANLIANTVDLLQLATLQGTATRSMIGGGNCSTIIFVRADAAVSVNDGYAEITRNSLPSNFATGEFSVSYVITQRSEGYIMLIPSTSTSPANGIGTNQDRQFGIWVRRNDIRVYYRTASSALVQTAVLRTSGDPFFDINNIATKHFTIVFTRTGFSVYVDCVFVGSNTFVGDIQTPSPGVNLFLGSARPHPSMSGGRLSGEVHGLYYHQQELSADQITTFCRCGFEALQVGPLPSGIQGVLDNDNTRLTITSSQTGGIIPALDISNILRSVNYTNQFDSPDLSARPLSYLASEANDREQSTSTGSIQLVPVDINRPTVTLGAASIDASASYTEDGPPALISPQAQINRAAVVTPTFSHVVVSLVNAMDVNETLNAIGNELVSVMTSENLQTLEIVGPSVPVQFNAVLRSVTYSNSNDNPTSSVNRRVTFLAYDTEGRTNEVLAVSTITIIPVNDPPEVSLSSVTSYSTDVVQFQEGTDGVLVAPNITVTDVDSVTLQSAILVLTSPAHDSDTLVIPSPPVSGISISYNAGTLSLMGEGPLEDYQLLLASVQFRSTDSPFLDSSLESLMRSISIEVSDGDLSSTETTVVQVQFVPNNDAPSLMLDEANVIFRDNDIRILIAPTGNISDSDNRQLSSMTVELQDVLDNNVLSYQARSGRVLQFGQTSVADMVAILRSISYVNLAAEPSLVSRVITVMVCDFMLCTNSTITVDIVDVNDNPPMFSFSSYDFTAREDSTVGTTVGTLQVSDLDQGDTRFTFSSNTQEFSLRPELSSVHILVNTTLDYEATRSYAFNVTANDGQNSASALVNILIINVNEPPSFRFTPPQPAIVVSSASQNELIQVPFEIQDPDENDTTPRVTFSLMNVPVGSNESLSWSQTGSGYMFQLVGEGGQTYELTGPGDAASLTLALQGVMYVAGAQIVDPTAIRSVAIALYDRSNASSEVAQVTVSLASIPEFSQEVYNVSIMEEEEAANFLRVQATVESGGNIIEYSVEQGRGILIDNSTGNLSLQQPLDREVSPLLVFLVYATDHLPPARVGTATVRLTVSDINDVRPSLSGLTNITLSTNTPIMPFSSISVEDPDTVGNITNATVSVTGPESLTRSTITGQVCVDESNLIEKMNSVCGGLSGGAVLLERLSSDPAVSVEDDNLVITLTGSNAAVIDTSTAILSGVLVDFTFVAWVQPRSSGYIIYYGTRDTTERYFAMYYNAVKNQLIVTLKREGVSGLSAQIRIGFQLEETLVDGNYHFIILQYISRSVILAVDGVQIDSLSVVYKSQMFIGQAYGKLLVYNVHTPDYCISYLMFFRSPSSV